MCLSYMQPTDVPCVYHTCNLLMDHVFIIHAAYWWTMCLSYMQPTDEPCVYHTDIIIHVVYELFSLRGETTLVGVCQTLRNYQDISSYIKPFLPLY